MRSRPSPPSLEALVLFGGGLAGVRAFHQAQQRHADDDAKPAKPARRRPDEPPAPKQRSYRYDGEYFPWGRDYGRD